MNKSRLLPVILAAWIVFNIHGYIAKHLRESTTVEEFYDAQNDEVVLHVVSKLIYNDRIKIMRIRDQKISLQCWSLTLGKNTHAVTCG